MHNILVAVDESDANAHVVEAAVGRAEREVASLVVVHVVQPRTYAARSRSMAGTAGLRRDGFTYTVEQAEAGAESVAVRSAREAVGDRAVPYVAVGAVGRLGPTIRATAAAYGCRTIVLAEEASWWRRRLDRLGRDLAKEFDGDVVRVPQPSPPESEWSLPEAEAAAR